MLTLNSITPAGFDYHGIRSHLCLSHVDVERQKSIFNYQTSSTSELCRFEFFQEEALINKPDSQSAVPKFWYAPTISLFLLVVPSSDIQKEDYEKVSIVDIEILQSGLKHFFEGKNTEDIPSNF